MAKPWQESLWVGVFVGLASTLALGCEEEEQPYSLSYDDANLIGVMRDGYPIYGRRDWNGTQPTDLDAYGGHTSITVDSLTPTYHYHVNEQTSTNAGSAGQKQWFLTKGSYRGSTGMCTGCQ